MLDIRNTAILLHLLKGAPMSVLFLVEMVKKPLSVPQICRLTGYPEGEVTSALSLLYNLDLVDNHSDGSWSSGESWLDHSPRRRPQIFSPN